MTRAGSYATSIAHALAGCLLLAAGACSESVELRRDATPSDASQDGRDANDEDDASPDDAAPSADATPSRDASPFPTDEDGRVVCGDRACLCDNGFDDDGDGLIDGNDPECTGPYDDDERSFATGIPGDNKDFCQDCFFDGNSGMGDDGCQYHTDCLYGRTPPGPGAAGCFNCKVSQQCVDFCQQRTPNGCDCFGCCEIQRSDGSSVNVFLDPACSLDAIDDADACPRCTPSPDCRNDCDRCELCPGRRLEDLPADCNATPACEGGAPTCSDSNPCPSPDLYCQQGCCGARVI